MGTTEQITGMIPTVIAIGLVKKTSDTFFGTAKGKKVPKPSEKKLMLRR